MIPLLQIFPFQPMMMLNSVVKAICWGVLLFRLLIRLEIYVEHIVVVSWYTLLSKKIIVCCLSSLVYLLSRVGQTNRISESAWFDSSRLASRDSIRLVLPREMEASRSRVGSRIHLELVSSRPATSRPREMEASRSRVGFRLRLELGSSRLATSSAIYFKILSYVTSFENACQLLSYSLLKTLVYFLFLSD